MTCVHGRQKALCREYSAYVTAVAVGQRQRLYSGVSVRMFTWFYLSSIYGKFVIKGSILDLGHWYISDEAQFRTC